jgi:nucleotide-binding universal stress UspA family protein
MYRRILVATDGSRYSDAAVSEAIRMARESDGTLIIVSFF